MNVTLDVGLETCSEDVLFEGNSCWCQVWSRFDWSRKYWSWFSKEQYLAFIPYRLRINKRTEERSISTFSCMPSVVKDWLVFYIRSCSLVLATHFPIRFSWLYCDILWVHVLLGDFHKTRHHVLQQWSGYRKVTLTVDVLWSASMYANPESMPLLQ